MSFVSPLDDLSRRSAARSFGVQHVLQDHHRGSLVDHLPAVTLLLRVHGNSEVELDALRRRREIDDKLARLVQAAAKEGALRDDVPPDLASKLVFGMVNSLIEWVRPDGKYDKDTLADAVSTITLDGLRK